MGCFFKRFLKGASISILLLFLLWAAIPTGSWAQTTLSRGDVILVSINSDSPGSFDFVPLVNLNAGTVIHFSDNAYLEANHSLKGDEGTITYTAPGSVSAGTLLSYSGSNGHGFRQTDGNFSLSGSGDNILVFQSTATDTTFLYGAGFARGSSVWTYSDRSSKNRSDIPPSLTFNDNTIISLGSGVNYQYDISHGTKGTKLSLFDKVGNESNWSVNNDGTYTALNTDFTLLPPPAIVFSTDAQSVTEGNSVTITVKLTEAHHANVDVDVNFLGSLSSASSRDIDGHISNTVHFRNASTGATQSIAFTPQVNREFNGSEKAIFRLQNNTNGTIMGPDRQTITINERQTPKVVINEILYDPKGDANHDGTVDADGDEFVELVNNSGQSLDISNWTLSEGGGGGTVRYHFKPGTIIPSQKAFVVFSDSAEGTGFGGAYLFGSGKPLSLNNAGDEVVIKNAQGNVVTSYRYNGSENGESITRNPDITGNFMAHESGQTNNRSSFSPGTKIDGTAFEGGYAVAFRGGNGYRFVSTPAQGTSFNDLFGNFWTQGITGSDAPGEATPNIYEWDESGGGSFGAIGSMDDAMTPGKGYIIYTYDDEKSRSAGTQDSSPKTVNTRNAENVSPVSVAVSANDNNGDGSIDDTEGYNLLGNPFRTNISVDGVLNALESVARTGATINQHVYVWNNATSSYDILDRNDGTIAPFQAFFVRITTDKVNAVVSLNRSDLAVDQGTSFYKKASKNVNHFTLRLGQGGKFDQFNVAFSKHGNVGEDKYDGYKLFSLRSQSIQLYSTIGNGVKLKKNILPSMDDLEGDLIIPLGFSVPSSGEYTFRWGDLEQMPQKVGLHLVDHKTGQEIDLRSSQNYTFNETVAKPANEQTIRKKGLLVSPKIESNSTDDKRFELIFKTSSSNGQTDDVSNDQETRLGPNYPNPFSNYTKLKLTLKQKSEVKATIYNIVGQKVATIMRGRTMDKGDHTMEWSVPPNMPSGIYICKIEAGGKVLTRKMTLVK